MGKRQNSFCVKWDGVKTYRGHINEAKYTWVLPSEVPQEMISKYEALGPAIKYSDTVPQQNPFQHVNQQPIQQNEIKDVSGYQTIELLVDNQKYVFYKMPQQIQYRGKTRILRYPYFMCRKGIIWNNTDVTTVPSVSIG
jgi:hypothetical protein